MVIPRARQGDARPRQGDARHRGGVGRAHGFTLTELVAVIVVLGIIAVSAAPALERTSRAARTAGATQIARDIAYARERALATGLRVWVSIQSDGLAYSLLADNPASPGRVSAITLTDPAHGGTFDVALDAGVRIGSVAIEGGGRDLGFDWLGCPAQANGAALTTDASVGVDGGPTIYVRARTGLVVVAESAG